MQLAKVVGTVVATRKEDALIGFKLLVVETLQAGREDEKGNRYVVIDTLGAGVNDTVLVVTGGAARAHLAGSVPVDATIIGIVDSTDVQP